MLRECVRWVGSGSSGGGSSKAGVVNFALTSQVLSEGMWTEATLQKRQNDLTGRIETLWRLK